MTTYAKSKNFIQIKKIVTIKALSNDINNLKAVCYCQQCIWNISSHSLLFGLDSPFPQPGMEAVFVLLYLAPSRHFHSVTWDPQPFTFKILTQGHRPQPQNDCHRKPSQPQPPHTQNIMG